MNNELDNKDREELENLMVLIIMAKKYLRNNQNEFKRFKQFCSNTDG